MLKNGLGKKCSSLTSGGGEGCSPGRENSISSENIGKHSACSGNYALTGV